MGSATDLTAIIQQELRELGDRFQVEIVDQDWLRRHNLKMVQVRAGVECIDERPLELKALPRTGTKLPGASLGEAVLAAIQQKRPVTEILKAQLRGDRAVYLHDDDHHRSEWPFVDKNGTGCGFNDKLEPIVRRFLELDEAIPEDQIPAIAAAVTGHQTSAARLRELTKASGMTPITYAGEHTGRRLMVNTLAGKTLDHLVPDGERSFVVDAGSAKDPAAMAKLALATVDVLLPPDTKIELAILRPGK